MRRLGQQHLTDAFDSLKKMTCSDRVN